MEAITIIPKDKKQASVIKAFLKEMNIKFKMGTEDETQMSAEEFYARIDNAIRQAEEGKGTVIRTKKELHDYLDLLTSEK